MYKVNSNVNVYFADTVLPIIVAKISVETEEVI